MNIILLSGGSGTRLWPLSNGLRSKQFIKLFKNGHEYKSMVQRVYRQIKTVSPTSKITIATSKSQVSAIKNHLGNSVSICVEPCRMDTFPAIALACFYLRDILRVNDNEPVIICPVDPYVDNSYFESLITLENLVNEGNSNLTLMGIEPTCPSEKYGYIIPDTSDMVSRVRSFKEKPNSELAKKYLKDNALWNAGVFGAKLSYLLDKCQKLIQFKSYNELLANFSKTKRISFDYAVVEQEPSIQVLRYKGKWKDVGTWNMLSEVMSDSIKGNALMDEFCINSNIVNELNIPILCLGAKNMVIAASCDGILVSDKERSGYMKPYVEKIRTGDRFSEKSWGTYSVIDVQPKSITAIVALKKGESQSYHSHENRKEIMSVIEGSGTAVIDGVKKALNIGDVLIVEPNQKHTIKALTDIKLVETQIGDEISSKDKHKYEQPNLF